LRWEDIHEDYLSLYTHKAKNSNEKEIKVPMNSVLKDVLSKIPREGEYVFMNPATGKHYGYRRRLLHTLCREAGVKFFSYHCLRHFGASKLDNAGVPIADIQEILGHSQQSTTHNYIQSLRGSANKSVRHLEDLK
jgi:integrase